MSCPKCGYSGHNTVSHWGTGEIECENCRHDYVPAKNEVKEQDKNRSKEIALRLRKPVQQIDDSLFAPRDFYVTGTAKGASADFSPIGPVRIGRVSDDNRVRGDDGLIVGKITPTDHFTSHWW